MRGQAAKLPMIRGLCETAQALELHAALRGQSGIACGAPPPSRGGAPTIERDPRELGVRDADHLPSIGAARQILIRTASP